MPMHSCEQETFVHSPSRRTIMAGAAALALTPAVAAAGLAASPNDPLLDLIRECEAGEAAYEALDTEDREEENRAVGETWGPSWEALKDAPVPTTLAGACAAMEFVCDEGRFGGFEGEVEGGIMRAVLEYLHGLKGRVS